VVAFPLSVIALARQSLPAWVFMWLFAFAIYAGCKWLTWWTAPAGAPWPRQLGYLLLWPGMDASAFLFAKAEQTPAGRDWILAAAKFTVGAALVWVAAALLHFGPDLLRGWVALVGIVFVLHFGVFHLLSLAWQLAGRCARPLMDWPILATSVSDFWGRRWNLAFRDLTHRFVFRPLTARLGARPALLIGFSISGIVHDLVISLPAGAGHGGPTLFFAMQAAALLVERSAWGRRLGLSRGAAGWAFTMLVLAAPIGLLFHAPFIRTIIVPMLNGEW
jgi:hypothetical protein